MIDNGGNGHHAIPPYLKSLGVETLILGNRGQGAIVAITASGLKEMPRITGSADEAAELFAKGELYLFAPRNSYDENNCRALRKF